jgi:hypothetical protein
MFQLPEYPCEQTAELELSVALEQVGSCYLSTVLPFNAIGASCLPLVTDVRQSSFNFSHTADDASSLRAEVQFHPTKETLPFRSLGFHHLRIYVSNE